MIKIIKNSAEHKKFNIQKEHFLIEKKIKIFLETFNKEKDMMFASVFNDSDIKKGFNQEGLDEFITWADIMKSELKYIAIQISHFMRKIEDIFPFIDFYLKKEIYNILDTVTSNNSDFLNKIFIQKKISEPEKLNWFKENYINSYQLLSDKLNELINNLKHLIGGTTELEEVPLYNLNIDGINVIINNFRHRDISNNKPTSYQERYESSIKKAIEEVRLAISKIKRSGYGNALKDFKIVISENSHILGIGGHFNPKPISIDPFSHVINIFLPSINSSKTMPLERILCHEFAHKFYYLNLQSNARDAWRDIISKGKIEKNDLKNIYDIIPINYLEEEISNLLMERAAKRIIISNDNEIKKAKSILNNFKINSLKNINLYSKRRNIPNIEKRKYELILNNFYKFIDQFIESDRYMRAPAHTVHGNLLKTINDYFYNNNLYSNDNAEESSSLNLLPQYALEEDLTEYAMTSPSEAFAEALGIYIYDGPRAVPPLIRNFLVNISLTGGASPKYSEKFNLNNILKISNIFYNLSKI